MKSVAIIVAITLLCSSSAMAGRTILKDAADDVEGAYPTYDPAYASNVLNNCFDKWIGLQGSRIPANAGASEIVSGVHNCLGTQGLRYSVDAASTLSDKIKAVADAKAAFIAAISERLEELLALDAKVDSTESEVENGFDASQLSSLSA